MSEEERHTVNPFEFKTAFAPVMKMGGFDAVIGNPPYRREKDYKYLLDVVALTPFGREHKSPRMDLWYYFVHRSMEMLRPAGALSFITNAYWMSGTGAEKLIALIAKNSLEEVVALRKLGSV